MRIGLIKNLFLIMLVVTSVPWSFGFISLGQAAVIYVAKVDGSVKYCDFAWPDETTGTIGDLETALSVAGEDGTIVISGGLSGLTYVDGDMDVSDNRLDAQANGQTVRGSLPSDDPSGLHTGAVTLSSTTNHVVYNPDKTGFFLKNIRITGGPLPPAKYGIVDACQTNTEDVKIDGTDQGLLVQADHNTVHTRLVVSNCTDPNGASIRLNGGSTYSFHYCVIEGNQSLYALHALQGTSNFYNCLVVGNRRYAAYTAGTSPVLNIRNSIFAANITALDDLSLIRHNATSGGIYVSTSLLLDHPTLRSSFLQDVTLPSPDDNLYVLPQFAAGRRPAILVLGVDDSMNYEYWKALAAECSARGFRAVLFANTGSFYQWGDLQGYVNAGHEVASHTRWHSNMTSFDGICIQYIGSGEACTLSIHNNTLFTTVSGGPGGENLNIDLLDAEFDSLRKLASHINEYAGYACVWENTLGSATRSKCLADVFGKNIKTSLYTCPLDADRLYDEELLNSKSDIENNLVGYVCKTFAPPGNRTNELLEDALKARGYLGARGAGSSIQYLLEDIRVYRIKQHLVRPLLGSSEAEIRLNAAAFCEYLNYVGGIYVLYAHNEYEFSIDQWKVFLDEVAQSNVSVMTFSEAIEHIRNLRSGFLPPGTDADADGEHWTRTLSDQSDYRLRPTSPCIDTGADLALSTDFFGTPVPSGNGPDVGIFEFIDDGETSLPFFFAPVPPCRIVDTRLAGGAVPPGGVRNYNVWGEIASQGGNPDGCPSPNGEPHAVYLNITAVPLEGSGNFLAFPFGSSPPNASLLNYRKEAQNIANSATVKTCFNCAKDISVKSNFGTAHLVIDVMGYYFPNP